MNLRNGRVIAALLPKRFAPFLAFSSLPPLHLPLGCVVALIASSLSAKASPALVEKVDQPWKIAVLQRAGGLENRTLFFLDFEKNRNARVAHGICVLRRL
jgi:hypothetical protein